MNRSDRTAGILLLVGAALGLIGMLLPWVTVRVGYLVGTRSAFELGRYSELSWDALWIGIPFLCMIPLGLYWLSVFDHPTSAPVGLPIGVAIVCTFDVLSYWPGTWTGAIVTRSVGGVVALLGAASALTAGVVIRREIVLSRREDALDEAQA